MIRSIHNVYTTKINAVTVSAIITIKYSFCLLQSEDITSAKGGAITINPNRAANENDRHVYPAGNFNLGKITKRCIYTRELAYVNGDKYDYYIIMTIMNEISKIITADAN